MIIHHREEYFAEWFVMSQGEEPLRADPGAPLLPHTLHSILVRCLNLKSKHVQQNQIRALELRLVVLVGAGRCLLPRDAKARTRRRLPRTLLRKAKHHNGDIDRQHKQEQLGLQRKKREKRDPKCPNSI